MEGNQQKMREALVSIRALIDDEPDGTPMIDAMRATIFQTGGGYILTRREEGAHDEPQL